MDKIVFFFHCIVPLLLFFYIYIYIFFLSITTKYIQHLITMLLKIKLMKQDNAGHLFYFLLFFFNKQNKNKNTHTYTQKKGKKRKRDEITRSCPFSFSFWTEYQSIIWLMGCHFFNNLSLFELVNSFSISLIFLIVVIKLLNVNCLVFLVL